MTVYARVLPLSDVSNVKAAPSPQLSPQDLELRGQPRFESGLPMAAQIHQLYSLRLESKVHLGDRNVPPWAGFLGGGS